MIGSKAYKNSAKMAGLGPIPKNGIMIPNKAMLGIVCNTPAIPKTIPAIFRLLAIKIHNGIAITSDKINEINVNPIWAVV